MANEKRLIDANALNEQMAANFQQALWYGCDDSAYPIVEETIDDAPTVDAVEVVRCRDCFANGCCSVQIDLDMGGEGYCPKGRRINQREFETAAEVWNGYVGRERKYND